MSCGTTRRTSSARECGAGCTPASGRGDPVTYESGIRKVLGPDPDAFLPDYGVYVEFWGLVNVPDDSARSRYERSMRWKMARYHRNGIRFVSLHPSDLNNLNAAFRAKLEKAAGRAMDLSATAHCANCGQPVYSGGTFCAKCGAKL